MVSGYQTAQSGAAAMATRQAAYHLEESGRRVHRDPETGDLSPPVLLLSHFCPSPFLCFGDVCVGATRTRSLILQNLNEELSLQRAADQGFSVVPSCCELKAYWKRYSARKQFLKLKYYSVILQSGIRMKIALTSFKCYHWATVTIQRRWCVCLRRKQDQQRFKLLKSSYLVIQFKRMRDAVFRAYQKGKLTCSDYLQAPFRRMKACHLHRQVRAACILQSYWRM